eukprot:1160092-Pelagomonas_calceolata.AAC.9
MPKEVLWGRILRSGSLVTIALVPRNVRAEVMDAVSTAEHEAAEGASTSGASGTSKDLPKELPASADVAVPALYSLC